MNARDAFDASAQIYDRTRRQLVPCLDNFYGTVLELIPFTADDAFEALDLGAGTGLLSALVATVFPHARFTLLDVSNEMLTRARERFKEKDDRFRFILGDFAEPLPGTYDLAISALAIHHLGDEDKRGLFARVLGALRPGGRFINADQVMGPTPALEEAYQQTWLRQVHELGVPQADLDAALERMKADRMAPLEPQLEWLRLAGFLDVDCWFKSNRFAVYSGSKPG